MTRFSITRLPLEGLIQLERRPIGDKRGFLARLFCADELMEIGFSKQVVQINHTRTEKKGTVRGLHFQHPPHAEIKLVSCLRGSVWDVAVDLREESPTFLKWHGLELSAANNCALLIPEGFAHGFQSLTENVEMLYCHSAAYAAAAEGGICPTDPELEIGWPLPISEMSPRDLAHSEIDAKFAGLKI